MQFGTERFHRLNDKKKTIILDALASEFATNGYRSASTNHVASTVDISKGALFSYFPTKGTMLLAVLERELERAQTHFIDADKLLELLSGPDKLTLVSMLLRTIDDVTSASPTSAKLYRVWADTETDSSRFEPMLRDDFERLSAAWRRYLRQPIEALAKNCALSAHDNYHAAAMRLVEALLVEYALAVVRDEGDKLLLGWHRSVTVQMVEAAFPF